LEDAVGPPQFRIPAVEARGPVGPIRADEGACEPLAVEPDDSLDRNASIELEDDFPLPIDRGGIDPKRSGAPSFFVSDDHALRPGRAADLHLKAPFPIGKGYRPPSLLRNASH